METRDKVPAGGFIDLGKHASILSTLLAENVAKIAPTVRYRQYPLFCVFLAMHSCFIWNFLYQNDRFKHLQEILEVIHLHLKQPANATSVSVFPFPHVAKPAPSMPPPPAPLGIPITHRGSSSSSSSSNSQALNHQYQVPSAGGTPIYAVSNVIHNNANPNVKNISQLNANWNNNPQHPLKLQIPNGAPTQLMLNNPRSGSQASSGYQSQSPVLEGEDKNKKLQPNQNINIQIINANRGVADNSDAGKALQFNNPVFNRKSGSQSVDDLSSLGVDLIHESVYKRRYEIALD
jgi:hypothetical protein